MDRVPMISLFLFLLALGWGFVLTCGLAYAARTGRGQLARVIGFTLVSGLSLYGALLLVTSFTSREIVLPEGERKGFCGFYLDCHVGFAVRGVRFEEAESGGGAGDSAGEAGDRAGSDGLGDGAAGDRLCVVDLAIVSDARRITIMPGPLDIAIVDRNGGKWRRDAAAEASITGRPFLECPFDRLLPAGESYARTIVFRLRSRAVAPRLLVREDFWADRYIETFLIGDDDSLFHRRTYFAIGQG